MRVIHSKQDLAEQLAEWQHNEEHIALVPTMGNLHAGHIALVNEAGRGADRVVTSIYVNPTQFGEGEDFQSYPRTLEADCSMLQDAGCDLVFIPDNDTMYPGGTAKATQVTASPRLSCELEGACRPGHFDGVVTVVARLFNMVTPDLAVFGEKDYQQLLVIKHMVRDLAYPVEIVPLATVREADGLAMSSRNGYLDPQQRNAAAVLNRVLKKAADRFAAGEAGREDVELEASDELSREGFVVDYVAIRRASDLAVPAGEDKSLRILAAARCGSTRLIDNRPLNKK